MAKVNVLNRHCSPKRYFLLRYAPPFCDSLYLDVGISDAGSDVIDIQK